jgi:hypothetical protein
VETDKRKPDDPGTLEKKLKRLKQKPDSENEALVKILRNAYPGISKKQTGPGNRDRLERRPE